MFEEGGRNERTLWGRLRFPGGSADVSWHLDENVFASPAKLYAVQFFDGHDRPQGLQFHCQKDGSIEWQVPWVRGLMHGLARQFDESGEELLRSRFVRGTGLDVWVNCGAVSEMRVHRRNVLHGVERWGHPRLPWEECHYVRGLRSGILRRWTGLALEDGYPKYMLDGEEVSRKDYLRARRSRPELVPDRREDDLRHRRMHPLFARVWLRKDIRARLESPPDPDREGC